jgi:hypothetical protein
MQHPDYDAIEYRQRAHDNINVAIGERIKRAWEDRHLGRTLLFLFSHTTPYL